MSLHYQISEEDAGPLDAVVIGSGPNGLAAAITLAQAGRSVLVREAKASVGGGARSAELTLPGFVHDLCSSVHPMALSSPFFRSLPLARHGLKFIHPPVPLAHPFEDGTAALLSRSVRDTADSLGARDSRAYRRLFEPLAANWEILAAELLRPIGPTRHPIRLAGFGMRALRSVRGLAESRFEGERARALFAGIGAHSCLPLEKAAGAAFGLVLAAAGHAVGWPVVQGGSQNLTAALTSHLRELGGRIVTNSPVRSLDERPRARAILCDITPRQLLRIAGPRLPSRYRRRLERYRYGPGVFKMDWALDGPVPWKATSCAQAATVHLGGTIQEMAASERAAWNGEIAERPYVIVVQASLFDSLRAPPGRHTLWAYCHVPNGTTADMSARIEAQIERFAPGFRDRILARHMLPPAELEAHNANLVGGDISGGAQDLGQLFLRPTARRPYTTPLRDVYLCSSSTPPGGGVHGMCGHHAAMTALGRSPR